MMKTKKKQKGDEKTGILEKKNIPTPTTMKYNMSQKVVQACLEKMWYSLSFLLRSFRESSLDYHGQSVSPSRCIFFPETKLPVPT